MNQDHLNELCNHQAHPLRVSLPTEQDSLTRRKTGQPTINERPTGEASGLLSLEPPFDLESHQGCNPPTRRDHDWLAITQARQREMTRQPPSARAKEALEWYGHRSLQLRRAIDGPSLLQTQGEAHKSGALTG